MHKIVLIALVALIISGCSLKNSAPRVSDFRLEPKIDRFVQARRDDRVLGIQRVSGDRLARNRAILYKQDGALKPYKYGRWSEDLGSKLQDIFISALEQQALFKAVVSDRSMAGSDLILESTLENFEEQYDTQNPRVFVNMRFVLVERKSGKVLDSVFIATSSAITNAGASGTVAAFDDATRALLKDLSRWLYDYTK